MRAKAYPVHAALLGLVLAGCQTAPTAPTRGATETSDEAVDEAVAVQGLRREVAELRDTVEVQRNELKKLRERQRELYDDLDYRLREKEQGATGERDSAAGARRSDGQGRQGYGQIQSEDGSQESTSGQRRQTTSGQQDQDTPSRSGDQEVYGQQGVAQQDQAGNQQDGRQPGQSSQEQQTAAIQQSPEPGRQQSSQKAVASAEEQSAYDSAFELLKQSRYNDAIIEFRSMISQFPDGALVDDAQYWIGEAYYVTRDFESAREAFQAVVNRYSGSQRVPEALLKLGYVQAELGRKGEARRTLNQVISQYPGSRVAISAETRLSKIR